MRVTPRLGEAVRAGEQIARLAHHAVALLKHSGAELALVDRDHKSRAPEGQRTAALRLPHVKDVATSWWALPLVVAEGRKGPDKDGAAAVDAIREAMAAPAPEDRLSFGDALARLEESSPT